MTKNSAREEESATSTTVDDAENHGAVEGERGSPTVNRSRSFQSRVTSTLALALGSLMGGGLLLWYYGRALSEDPNAQQTRRARPSPAETFLPALTLPPEPLPRMDDSIPTPPAVADSGRGDVRRGSIHSRDNHKSGPLASPVFTRHRSASQVIATVEGAEPADAIGQGRTSSRDSTDDLAAMLKASSHQGTFAYRMGSPEFTLRAGTYIPCVLETAITSSIAGATRCITSADTWGADGTSILMERGTTLVGETRGNASAGNHRLFILWTRAYTPKHVIIPLDAPGTDALGRSGVTGDVNYHFWQRFGAAMLVSVIDGVAQSATRADAGNNSVVINTNASQEIVTEALRQAENIRPTIDVSQGSLVQVGVTRDVDFRGAYELATSF